jgi:hypothetical protein
MRSTIAPEMRAAVMIANVPWYDMNSTCGIVPCGSSPTFLSRARERSPMAALPGPKASEYPINAHTTPTTPSAMKLIIIVFSAFFVRTRPP